MKDEAICVGKTYCRRLVGKDWGCKITRALGEGGMGTVSMRWLEAERSVPCPGAAWRRAWGSPPWSDRRSGQWPPQPWHDAGARTWPTNT